MMYPQSPLLELKSGSYQTRAGAINRLKSLLFFVNPWQLLTIFVNFGHAGGR